MAVVAASALAGSCDGPAGCAGDPSDSRWTQISVGGAHACGLTLDGAVACWGCPEGDWHVLCEVP